MADPPQKKRSTLGILLAVIGVGVVAMAIATAIVGYLVWSSPKGREMVGAVGKAIRVARASQNAPGAKELRAMGCKSSMIMSVDDLSALSGQKDAAVLADAIESLVVCGVSPFTTPPTCDDVSRTYIGAVGRRQRPFLVMVQRTGRSAAECSVLYEGSGEPLRAVDFDAPAAPETDDEEPAPDGVDEGLR